jgi:hypothetical protein
VSATPQFRISIKLNNINGTAKSRYPGIAGNAKSGSAMSLTPMTLLSQVKKLVNALFFTLIFFEGTI